MAYTIARDGAGGLAITLQPVYFDGGVAPGNAGAGGTGDTSGTVGAALLAAIGATSAAFTDGGSLSALASKRAICHICVSERDLLKPGMPVRRIPLKIFQ